MFTVFVTSASVATLGIYGALSSTVPTPVRVASGIVGGVNVLAAAAAAPGAFETVKGFLGR